jgi:alpha-glucuronidase
VEHYTHGADRARQFEARWKTLEGTIDGERFQAVLAKLHQQAEDAATWRDKCLRYFQTFSKRPI